MLWSDVPIVGQSKVWGCWAAAFTIVDSWRTKKPADIARLLGELGEPYPLFFETDTGLYSSDAPGAVSRLGLIAEPASNPSPARWLQLLNRSPLFVWVDEDAHPNVFAVHARVLVGIDEPLSAASIVRFIDPGGNNLQGSMGQQSLTAFVQHYEALAKTSWKGVQIYHY